MTSRVRIGLVGTGSWGLNWVRAIERCASAELVHLADPSTSALAAASSLAPGATASEAVGALLADPRVEAVVVATPTSTHHAVGLAALRAGKDVLVEKPLATRVADALELTEEAARHGRIVVAGHLMMFHPAVALLEKLVREGDLGELRYLHAQRLNLGIVRRDESAWSSLAPHDIAIANHLFGSAPESVSCTGGSFVRPHAADVAFATLAYPGGRLAHLHVSWLDPNKVRRLTVVGSKKMACFDDTSPTEKVAIFDRGVDPPPSLTWAEGVHVRTGDVSMPVLPLVEPLAVECEAFALAVRSRRAPARATPAAAIDVVRVLEAGATSLESGGAPTRLQPIEATR